MKKTIITVIAIILTIGIIGISSSPQTVFAQIGSDIDGEGMGATEGEGGGKMGYSMKIGNAIKISLVDVSGSYPIVHDTGKAYIYYVSTNVYYNIFTGQKYEIIGGKETIFGKINGTSYSSDGISATEKIIYTADPWFYNPDANWSVNINPKKIEEKLSDTEFFAQIVNQLNIQSLLDGADFDINKLTAEQIKKLKDYRLIVEPVYAMNLDEKLRYKFATVKGWAKIILEEQRIDEGIGDFLDRFATNVYASNSHGCINSNGLRNLGTEKKDIFNAIADVKSGYGYGVFYVIGGCDPSKQCCYDEKGIYHEDYSGESSNYKCENGVEGKNCENKLIECSGQVNECPKSEGQGPSNFSCENKNETFKEVASNEKVSTERTLTADNGDEYTKYWQPDPYEEKLTPENGWCSNELTQTITGTVSLTQNGKFQNHLTTNIYSGGGFSFDASYAGNASYQLCGVLTYQIDQVLNDPLCTRYENKRDTRENSYSTKLSTDGTTCHYKHKTRSCDYNTEEKKWECSEWTTVEDIETSSELNCKDDTKIYYCSNNSAWEGNCNGTKDSTEADSFKAFATEMKNKFLQDPEPAENAQTLSRDSNNEKSEEVNKSMGNWTGNIVLPEAWYPGEENKVSYKIEFEPYLSCINARTARVDYFPYVEGDSCEKHNTDKITYIDGTRFYYVPLKTNLENKSNYIFPVSLKIPDISLIKSYALTQPENAGRMKWSLEYKCGVNCDQNLYNEKGNFKFIYRPIDMSNPFPKIVNENRQIGKNWETFMSDKNAIEDKMNRKEDNKEYTVMLTPTLITEIKNYNDNKNYTSLDTIYDSGISDFLKTRNILNMKQDNYNKLGYCTDECWLTEGTTGW